MAHTPKTCPRCKATDAPFYSGGFYCKQCSNALGKESRLRYDRKPEILSRKSVEKSLRRSKNPSFKKTEAKRALDRYHSMSPAEKRAKMLQSKYGMTLVEWEVMFELQGKSCAICRAQEPGSKKGWATDHDHRTGKVRAILCPRCNITVGRVEILGLVKVSNYLETHNEK